MATIPSKPSSPFLLALLFILINTVATITQTEAQLSLNLYAKTCPNALNTIRTSIRSSLAVDTRMAAGLIRLHFHDCFVHGCDASILLDQTPTIRTEKTAGGNNMSITGFEAIDAAKARVEKICPGVVSCADIVAVAARDASAYVGGPTWNVKLGRRDSTSAYPDVAVTDLPSHNDDVETLIKRFKGKGLNVREMVALSGAHTLGDAQCSSFRDRIYSDGANIDGAYAGVLRRRCPLVGGDNVTAPFDPVTPDHFDNNYFRDLMRRRGLLASDQVLYSGGGVTDGIVREYGKLAGRFRDDFAAAMVKMGEIQPLTGSAGQIRRICGAVN
ncbi:unnamed protein product [Linum tenue]|uniref:Peroxidase n=3 Tax=Linum tenue TaxID=586396 RepID=A0AAV0IYG0_9ROSI|nr:unnamed protein product [Linum tenue]